MELLKENFPNLYSYIVINESIVYNAANDFIEHMSDEIVEYIDCWLEFEQYTLESVNKKDREKVYSGWCYDSNHQKFVETDDMTKFHPVYFVYHIAYMGNAANYCPEYRTGRMRVRNRDVNGKTKDELLNDEIVIDLFITNIRDAYSEYSRKTSLEVDCAHECDHIMKMYPVYVKDIPDFDKDELYAKISKELYGKFLGSDFCNDKSSEQMVKDISLCCYFYSHMEREAIKESIGFYTEKNKLDIAMRLARYPNVDKREIATLFVLNFPDWDNGYLVKYNTLRKKIVSDDTSKEHIMMLLLLYNTLVQAGFIKDCKGGDEYDFESVVEYYENEKYKSEFDDIINYFVSEFDRKFDEFLSIVKDEVLSVFKKYEMYDEMRWFSDNKKIDMMNESFALNIDYITPFDYERHYYILLEKEIISYERKKVDSLIYKIRYEHCGPRLWKEEYDDRNRYSIFN